MSVIPADGAGEGGLGTASGADGEPCDQIRLIGLRTKGFHGVLEHEREHGQDFVVDVVLHLDTRAAAGSDQLVDTVDYGALARQLAEVVRGEPVNLLETLAFRLAEECLAQPRVRLVDITVHKPQAPIEGTFGDVAVAIRRRRVVVDPTNPSLDTSTPVDAVIALGANLGDRWQSLRSAVAALAATEGVEIHRVSPVVETRPVGGPDQPDYLNAVVGVRTRLAPEALLGACLQIEAERGRTRDVRWGARTLDLDLLTYGDLVVATPGLQLPHPRAAQRAFVLVPWAVMEPAAVIPGRGAVVDLAVLAPDRDGVRLRPDLVLVVP